MNCPGYRFARAKFPSVVCEGALRTMCVSFFSLNIIITTKNALHMSQFGEALIHCADYNAEVLVEIFEK